MGCEIVLDEDTDVLRVTLRGTVDGAEILSALDEMTAEGVFVKDRRLWDLRGCDLVLSPSEQRRIAQIGDSRDLPGSRVAILADRDVNFGLGRAHAAYRGSSECETRVFREEKRALAWLRKTDSGSQRGPSGVASGGSDD